MVKHKSRLKEIRQGTGLTIDQVVEATGISKRTIITIENEEGANSSVDTVLFGTLNDASSFTLNGAFSVCA